MIKNRRGVKQREALKLAFPFGSGHTHHQVGVRQVACPHPPRACLPSPTNTHLKMDGPIP